MTSGVAFAAINIPFTINLSENVTVTGTPRIAVDVGGNTRYATYTSGTGTNALTFTLSPTIGDVDLDGVAVSSPIDLNGGTIKDTAGNDATLTFTPPNTSGIKINYPSLGMDFTNGTSGRYTLNGNVYNDLSSFLTASGGTFSRNSIATYFDSTGTLQTASANTPRFDYDPVTHIAKGILIEESRRNYTIHSNKISTSTSTGYFYSGDVTERFVQNAGTAPDGSNTASFASLNSRFFFESSAAGNGTYSMSVWLKMASGTGTAILTVKNRGTDDIKSSSSFTVTTNWQRFSLSGITDGSNPGFRAEVSYPAGMYAWGMQVEQGAFPTSYIPTTGLPATRDAENFYIPAGSWTGSSQGTIASTFDHFGTNTVDGIFALNDGTGNNRADCRAGQQYCFFSASGVDTPLSPLVSPPQYHQ
ncbi:MAG TPA: hypothetical protein DCM27_04595 [Rhodospirillaceae bacterium]|nr:hypothetical protein [Rhodospirillaceae bacterium]